MGGFRSGPSLVTPVLGRLGASVALARGRVRLELRRSCRHCDNLARLVPEGSLTKSAPECHSYLLSSFGRIEGSERCAKRRGKKIKESE
jgi:hypothetical protein